MTEAETFELSIASIDWQEQLNGFSLVTVQCRTERPTELADQLIGANFSITSAPETRLELFIYQITEPGVQLQLLTQENKPDNIEKADKIRIQPSRFSSPEPKQNVLLIGENQKMASIFALAKERQNAEASTLAFLHSEQAFPFAVKPARFMVDTAPAEAIGASALLEDWKIANRLSSQSFIAGCAQMKLEEMLDYWLQQTAQRPENGENWRIYLSASDVTIKACQKVVQSHPALVELQVL